MNNNNLNGGNHHRQHHHQQNNQQQRSQHAQQGRPSIPPQFQQHFQRHPQLQARNQDPQLAYLLANAAAGRTQQPPSLNAFQSMGAGNSGTAATSLFEEQILQRASALRAEALMHQNQQQHPYGGSSGGNNNQQQHRQQLQLQAAMQAFQQQHSRTGGPLSTSSMRNNSSPPARTPQRDILQQQQEAALLARAATLRDYGLASAGGSSPTSAQSDPSAFYGSAPTIGSGGPPGPGGNLGRMQEHLDMNALMRHRQQQNNHQRAFALEQELGRVNQTQRYAATSAQSPLNGGGPRGVIASNSGSSFIGNVPKNQSSNPAPTVASAQKTTALSKRDSEASEAPSSVFSSAPQGQDGPTASAASKNKTDVDRAPKGDEASTVSTSPKTSTAPSKTKPTINAPKKSSGQQRSAPESSDPELKTSEPMVAGDAAAAATTAASIKTKEEHRNTPGTVIVPCRARGMPMNHNFISAYFVISEDAKHGENLICSYFACRNGGVKFRYCAYCMAPVAKRNFSRRHDHGMSKNKGAGNLQDEEDDDDDDTLDEQPEKMECIPCDKELSGSEAEIEINDPQPPEKEENEHLPTGDQDGKRKGMESDVVEAESDVVEAKVEASIIDADDNKKSSVSVDSERQSMWNKLLTKRPRTNDPKELSSWLSEVIAISDVDFPLERVYAQNMNNPLGQILFNQLPTLTEQKNVAANGVEESEGDSIRNSSSAKDSIASDGKKDSDVTLGSAEGDEEASDSTKEEPDDTLAGDSTSKGPEKKPNKSVATSSPSKKRNARNDEEGFSGSFADWRDRKKGRSLKKGPGSLRK